MTASRDPDRLIRAFLDEGPDQLPDRSYDAVRSHIDRTRQRAFIGPWREPRMSNLVRIALAAAAVLAVAVVGYNLIPGSGGPGTLPSPTPSATPIPSPSPTPGVVMLPATGPLDPGTYYIDDRAITQAKRLTLTVAAGWVTGDGFLYKNQEAPGEVMLSTWVLTHIFDNACQWDEGSIVDVGTTVDALVSALIDQKGREASPPSDVTFAGFPAKRIELVVSASLDTATCTSGNLRYWPDPGPDFGGGLCCNAAGNTDVVHVVDVAGNRLVVVARHYPDSSERDKAELQAVLDSIRIEP